MKNNLKFITVPNPLKAQGTANYDYVGQFVSNGTVELEDLCNKLAAGRPNLDSSTAKLVVNTLFAIVRDEIAEYNYRFSLGDVSFASAISGSLPSLDSSLGEENKLYVQIVVGDALRRRVAALEPSRDTSDAAAVKIYGVEDAASHEVGVVHGTATAVVTGKNVSASQPGESIVLADLETGLAVSTGTVVAQDGLGQRIDVNFAAPFEAGDYWLVLTTRGYATPDAQPESYRKKVKATAALPPAAPTVTKVVDSAHASSSTDCFDKGANAGRIVGTNFGANPTVTLKYATSMDPSAEWTDCAISATASTATEIAFSTAKPEETGAAQLRFTVTAAGGAVAHTVAVSGW